MMIALLFVEASVEARAAGGAREGVESRAGGGARGRDESRAGGGAREWVQARSGGAREGVQARVGGGARAGGGVRGKLKSIRLLLEGSFICVSYEFE